METMYPVPHWMVDKYLPKRTQKKLEKMQPNVSHKYQKGITVKDLAEAAGCTVFDTAIPVEILHEILDLTGFNPVGHVVYDYTENKFGQLKAITLEGIIAIRIYDHLRTSKIVRDR